MIFMVTVRGGGGEGFGGQWKYGQTVWSLQQRISLLQFRSTIDPNKVNRNIAIVWNSSHKFPTGNLASNCMNIYLGIDIYLFRH